MATQIIIPEMGESITEGTIARWFKQVGDAVVVDEPLVEVETDKVTVEIPAPAAGTLSEIAAQEGVDVEVGAVIGAIAEVESAATAPAKGNGRSAAADPAPAPTPATEPEPAPAETAAPSGEMVDVTVPDMGESITEGTVGRWLKQIGDAVAVDEALVEIETDKVTAELPAPAAGTLSVILAEEGTDVEVGSVVGQITAGATATASAPAPAPTKTPAPAAKTSGSQEQQATESTAVATNLDYPLAPAVRKLIDEHGLDPARISASGKDGRLTKADVLTHIAGGAKAQPAPTSVTTAAPAPGFVPASEMPEREPDPRGEERVRMTKLRKTVAMRLKQAQNTAAMLTTFNEIDMSAVIELRTQYRDDFEKKHGVRLGFMSFFVKAAVNALKELPAVNAEIYGDEIVYKNYYDIGIAVGGAQGLVVPVLRDADEKNFAGIESAIVDFGARARDGKLTMAELTGGTFTITNGGSFGSMLSTPILNPPQSGILGMHNIVKRAVVIDDEIVARPMMYVALSYDHRIIDGREAVTFLVRIKQAIEDPQRLLVGV
ncbi:MAG: 2-oxoglutarate dehydrogenase complex dihydrolipoyllysine-residue succinyltransferase [Alphaproteobacteria bacterium]|nr:2-oxoglutarate dehydrogenase complex dihydrolipoyllysine-residue succinyltransferase [Alphaproteobacteria bacterium]